MSMAKKTNPFMPKKTSKKMPVAFKGNRARGKPKPAFLATRNKKSNCPKGHAKCTCK